MESKQLSAILVGEQAILISCAEAWLEAGHRIVTIASDNPTIQEWSANHRTECIQWDASTENTLSTRKCDYLFSLANLRILSESVLKSASVAAINFHDGPLPDYTGVNTPTWAIINGEKNHAISFHRMTTEVDYGEVLIHKSFNLSDDTTSLTANATCFELALSAFKELIEHPPTATSNAQSSPKTRTTNHYTKADRPQNSGLVDWTQSATEIERLTRALDFGKYDNPLCKAKIWNGGSLAYVEHCEIGDMPHSSPAGTILGHAKDSLTVACRDGSVVLSGITTHAGSALNGTALEEYVAESQQNQLTTPLLSDDEKLIVKKAAEAELYWRKTHPAITPLPIPYFNEYDAPTSTVSYDLSRQQVSESRSQWHTLAILVAYFARTSQRDTIDLGFYHPVSKPDSSQVSNQISAQRVISEIVDEVLTTSVALDNNETPESLASQLSSAIDHTTARGHPLQDLKHRLSVNWPKHRVTFGLGTSDLPADSDLHIAISDDGQFIDWAVNKALDEASALIKIRTHLDALFTAENIYDTPVSALQLLTDTEKDLLHKHWNSTHCDYKREPVHSAFESAALEHAEDIALVYESESVSYKELNQRANRLATTLIESGIEAPQKIGVLMDRSIEMIVALFAVLKSGNAYVPLDPTYPAGRLNHMVKDAELATILCDQHLTGFLDTGDVPLHVVSNTESDSTAQVDNPSVGVSADNLAYVIYTSGSTGLPKGVMVEHGNVANFFAAMDQKVKPPYDTWLAVTSISFDISVLEIFWTLARGFKVVLYSDNRRQKSQSQLNARFPEKPMDMSLFYWNVAEEDSIERSDKYRLLMEGARFADTNGFTAVWNPERHFAAFGGSFPNPAVTCAAIAATTENIQIRAGSCVAPLHSPIRIAEDWSVVDNLSNGRAGIAFASGWAPPDFAIQPENFANAKDIMFEHMHTVKKLWRGETVNFDGPKGTVAVRTLPRPIQKELPVWITTAGNIDSFKSAGKLGANILTHLLGQTLEQVSEKAEAYQQAWQEAGHPGRGKITVMLHTFVGEDKESVKSIVHQPMKKYLKSAMFLVKAAAWNFPTFKKLSDESGTSIDSYFDSLSEEDLDALLDFAFERYFETSGLFGSVDDASRMVDNCKAHGIDEIACLIDYGVDDQIVLDHLPYLAQVRLAACEPTDMVEQEDHSIESLIKHHNVTHLQCTPSMAGMLLKDDDTRRAIKPLSHLLVGGEALPETLARELTTSVDGAITNMYGPTETTIWSSTATVSKNSTTVTIGAPIANTQIYIVDDQMRLLPPGLPGELVIAGEGVVRGYHNNQKLTDERFIPNPYSADPDARMYRTGDLAMFSEGGHLVYLGRLDHQVKLHGYRIELGEIETTLSSIDGIDQAVVIVREDTPGDRRIVAYLTGDQQSYDPAELKKQLTHSLPEFMVPSVFVKLQQLPLTPNGKTDRNALPKPDLSTRATKEKLVAPSNDIEVTIAECWKVSLGVNAVGRKDNFFDIGGNSILLLDVLSKLNKQPDIVQPLKVTDVFRYSTVETLAGFISQHQLQADTGQSNSNDASQVGSRRAAMRRRRRSNKTTNQMSS